MNSDTNSDGSVFHTISQFNNSNVETPDEFADSEPSPSTHTQTNSSVFSRPPFQPIQTSHPLPSLSTPSNASQVTPTYSPHHSDRSYNNSPDTPQISQELDNFITLQQKLIHPNTLSIHQLSSTLTSSKPPTRTPSSAYTPSLAQSKCPLALTELIALLNENFQITHSRPNPEQPANILITRNTPTQKIFLKSPYPHFRNIH